MCDNSFADVRAALLFGSETVQTGHRDIRMVRVSSMQEADSFYTAMRSRHPECCADYTHEVPGGTYEVGIIYIRDSAVIAGGIREIHFVETVKPKEH